MQVYAARMSTQQNITAMVRYALASRRESQESLARVLGIAQSGVTNRLKGDIEWRPSELDKLAAHFGVSVAELVAPALPTLKPAPVRPVVASRSRVSVTRKYLRHARLRSVAFADAA